MEFSCMVEKIKNAVSGVALAILGKKTNLPILEGILLECKNNTLKLTGYDLTLGIINKIEVDMKKEGNIVLKAQLLLEILKSLDCSTVNVKKTDKDTALIYTETTQYKIAAMSEEEYPVVPNIEKQQFSIPIKNKTLKDMIYKTIFATSTNFSQNPILCGCLFDFSYNILTIVAVDGYRVALTKAKTSKNISIKFVVGNRALNEIYKLLDEDEKKTAEIILDKTHAIFKINSYFIVTRLLQGTFLDYKAAIPLKSNSNIVIDLFILQQSIKRVSIMATQNISVILSIQDSNIYLSCESNLGKANDVLKVKTSGEELEKIAFNSRFMLDALKHCDTEKIKIGFSGAEMPIKIGPEKGDDFLYLVLPVRVK